MKTSLGKFRSTFRDRVLDLLWRQWNTVGVAGHGLPWEGAPIDPDALLLVSCTVARHDARLFDAMLEWMGINGRYVNVHRTRRILTDEAFAGESVFRAVAASVKDSVSVAKWSRSASIASGSVKEPQPLFRLADGRPLPVVGEPDAVFAAHGFVRDRREPRGVVQPFRPEPAANLILRLRALLGVNARCEILAFLLLNGRGSPRAIARQTYYYPATVSKALSEMQQSGYVISHVEGRHRYYRLIPEMWRDLLLGGAGLTWIVWPRLFGALEQLWLFLQDASLVDKPALAQASALRRVLLGSAMEKIESGTGFAFGDVAGHPGEDLIPFFVGRMGALLDWLDRMGSERTARPWETV
jgi:hypothetical protein